MGAFELEHDARLFVSINLLVSVGGGEKTYVSPIEAFAPDDGSKIPIALRPTVTL